MQAPVRIADLLLTDGKTQQKHARPWRQKYSPSRIANPIVCKGLSLEDEIPQVKPLGLLRTGSPLKHPTILVQRTRPRASGLTSGYHLRRSPIVPPMLRFLWHIFSGHEFAQKKAPHAALYKSPSRDGAEALKKGHLDVLALPEFLATRRVAHRKKKAKPSPAWLPKSGIAAALRPTSGTRRAPQEIIVAELLPTRSSAQAIRGPQQNRFPGATSGSPG